MTEPSTKTEVVLLLERVRRAMPLNRDVMAVCDLLERAVVSTVASTSRPVASTREATVASTCERCNEARAVKARAQRRWRANHAGKRINPLDAPIK